MKILVIGSKGFIGTHALNYFRNLGHDVFGCDVVVEYNDVKYFQVDATNASYDEMFASADFDACINCSGAASVPDSFVHPSRDFHLNVQNVYSMLEAIRRNSPACRFLNLSSAAVYGNPDVLPVSESLAIKPLSPYGWHKYYSEMICREYFTHFKIPTCSVRIFSAFGPGLTKQLFWDWYQKIRTNKEVTLFGTGRESRDFIFIDDLMLALSCVLNKASFTANFINVANGREVFIDDAIKIFQMHAGVDFRYGFSNEVRPGDPRNWLADISTLAQLGYRQSVSFEEGIKQYIQWAKEKK